MKQHSVLVLSGREKEFADLLIEIGMRKNMAMVLAFLANIPEASSREIERGTDMRQPDVSIAIRYLLGQGWIKGREIPSSQKGRPMRSYSLAVPVKKIITRLEKETRTETNHRLALIRKIREYL